MSIPKWVAPTAVVLLSCLALLPQAALGLTFEDRFDGASINGFWWSTSSYSSNTVSLDTLNHRVLMTHAAATGGDANLIFNVGIQGDFTATVDYALVAWPTPNNYERIGIRTNLGAVERISDYRFLLSGSEGFVTHFGDGVRGGQAAAEMSGSLKVVRHGSTVEGWYRDGAGPWTLINAYGGAGTGSISLEMSVWTADPYGHPLIQVAFDNFRIDAPGTPNPVPLPSCFLLLTPGLFALGAIKRRLRR